jgi:hypothetical protein
LIESLQEYKEDPAVILVDMNYGGDPNDKTVAALKKEGHQVYVRGYQTRLFRRGIFSK